MLCKNPAKTLSAAAARTAVAQAALRLSAGKRCVVASSEVTEPLYCNLKNGDKEGVLIVPDAMSCDHEQLVESLETPGLLQLNQQPPRWR